MASCSRDAYVVPVDDEPVVKGSVVVAIDFGTSRTAYSWTVVGQEDEQIQVEKLSGFSAANVKAPTTVLIDKNGGALDFGLGAERKYAEEGEGKANWLLFKFFKMALHKSTEEDPAVKSVNGETLPLSAVLQRSLEFVAQQAMTMLKAKQILFQHDLHQIYWVLTLPAIWTDRAKSVMRKAAYGAGLISTITSNRLLLALEPECAAIASQLELSQAHLFQVGNKFLIADCGGGTLDITAHEVQSSEPLELRELIAPDGGPFGASQVDKNFLDFFCQFWGQNWFEDLYRNHPGTYLELTKDWEDMKTTFDHSSGDGLHLKLGNVVAERTPEDPNFKLTTLCEDWNQAWPQTPVKKRGKASLTMSHALVKTFFEGPVENIVKKVVEVVGGYGCEGVSQVVLAGGFANCSYLVDELRQALSKKGVTMILGNHPDLLIVKGAAMFGARPLEIISSRMCKYTFGVSAFALYDPKSYGEVPPEKIQMLDGRKVINLFCVHGRKGDEFPVDGKTPCQWYKPESEEEETAELEILTTRERFEKNVLLADDVGVRPLAKITIPFDMSKPFSQRVIGVEFSFGQTEVVCHVKDKKTGAEVRRLQPDFNFFDN